MNTARWKMEKVSKINHALCIYHNITALFKFKMLNNHLKRVQGTNIGTNFLLPCPDLTLMVKLQHIFQWQQ